jgi:hypothetical protein
MLLSSFSFAFQPVRAGKLSGRGRAPSSADAFDFGVSLPPRLVCQCDEYSSRIADLESRLTSSKRQAQMAIDKASKSCGFMKQISILEDKVSSLTAKIVHLEECNSFLVGIIESACELLRYKFSCNFPLLLFCCNVVGPCYFAIVGTSLEFVGEARRVSERIAALERLSGGVETFWSDPRRRSAIVLLQDRAQHIGEAVDGCRQALTTMYFMMLPRNPLPGTFPQLLAIFRSTQCIHRQIELNLVAGANFAFGWTRKWHPRLNFISMSLSLPSGGAQLRVHMDATLQPARRLIARLLRVDAVFFCEHHYLDPLGVDDSDQPLM